MMLSQKTSLSTLAILTSLTSLALLLSGCFGSYTANLADDDVTPQTVMIATPLERPLVVVIDPTKVPDQMSVEGTPHSVASFRGFFQRGLTKALSPYFQSIEFVTSPSAAPAGPHYLADVRVEGLKTLPTNVGGMTYNTIVMQWALALRTSDQEDYFFSYSGRANSHNTYRTLDDGMKQALENGLAQFIKGWTEKEVYKTLRNAEQTPVAPASTAEEPESASL